MVHVVNLVSARAQEEAVVARPGTQSKRLVDARDTRRGRGGSVARLLVVTVDDDPNAGDECAAPHEGRTKQGRESGRTRSQR